jgi:hypothetical protein
MAMNAAVFQPALHQFAAFSQEDKDETSNYAA